MWANNADRGLTFMYVYKDINKLQVEKKEYWSELACSFNSKVGSDPQQDRCFILCVGLENFLRSTFSREEIKTPSVINYENWDSQRQDLLDRPYRFCKMVYFKILKKLQFPYSTKIGKNGAVTFTEEVMNPNLENPKSPHENNTDLCFFIIEFLFESYYIEKEGKNLKQQRQIKTDNCVQIKTLLKTIFVMLPTEVEYLGDSASIKTKL